MTNHPLQSANLARRLAYASQAIREVPDPRWLQRASGAFFLTPRIEHPGGSPVRELDGTVPRIHLTWERRISSVFEPAIDRPELLERMPSIPLPERV